MKALGFKSLLLVGGLSATAGCSKSDEKSCAEVAGHIVKMARTELVKADAKTRKTANANLPTLQNSLMESCDAQKWPQSSRVCILNAKTVADTVDCKPESMPITGSPDVKPSAEL